MHKNKYNIAVICLIFLFAITLVSAIKPITSIETAEDGLIIETTQKDYLRTGFDHVFYVHVFNKSNGAYIITDTTCYMHLYHKDGTHVYEGFDDTTKHDFDYSFNLAGGNFSSRGEYQAKFQCNNTAGLGGGEEIFFYVNDYGEELSDAEASTFNFSMLFMFFLFAFALIGLFVVENYIGKFVLYWVCHVLFVIGTFSVWQFNQGYSIGFVGLAGVWKILFYVSTFAVVPMIILSLAWIFYIHTFNEHFEKLIEKGGNTEDAFRMAKRKSGGWFNGK